MKLPESRVGVRRWRGSREMAEWDQVAVERPLEVRINSWFKAKQETRTLGVLMRTPGNDPDLVAGFLLSEGIVKDLRDISEIRATPEAADALEGATVIVDLAQHVETAAVHQRATIASSSCGVCGRRGLPPAGQGVADVRTRAKSAMLLSLEKRVREAQSGFSQNGGLHAAALVSPDGKVESIREDVGRHNAVDKVIGAELLAGKLPIEERVLFVTSRSSFDIVQKALCARIPLLVTIGAPSTLAVEVAERYELTLVGFLREGRFNVYSAPWRVTP